jgi:D-glycero-D-manno-heptose 1,7-bisphosphate phosphatase
MLSTLFLDRDGVLNERIPGDYVRTPDAWQPVPRLGEAMRLLASRFDFIFVVTNQAGIGKGLMTEADLALVHAHMRATVEAAGGRIDGVFHCPHLKESGCPCRKPATGMAWQALGQYQDIDFSNAWMVGDSASDIRFGRDLGMKTALIRGKAEDAAALLQSPADFSFDDLADFARFIC